MVYAAHLFSVQFTSVHRAERTHRRWRSVAAAAAPAPSAATHTLAATLWQPEGRHTATESPRSDYIKFSLTPLFNLITSSRTFAATATRAHVDKVTPDVAVGKIERRGRQAADDGASLRCEKLVGYQGRAL